MYEFRFQNVVLCKLQHNEDCLHLQKKQLPFPRKNGGEARGSKPVPDKPIPSLATKKSSNTPKEKTKPGVSCRTRRFKNNAKALREIKTMQRSTSLLIPKTCFCRLVREIMSQVSSLDLRC